MASLKLNDGMSIPMLAFGSGTAILRTKRSKAVDFDQDAVDVIKIAIRAGYRHLDNAAMYGTEVEVGIAINDCIADGVIKSREDLFITTKVAENALEAEAAIDESLEKLQLTYVDLFLIHAPYFSKNYQAVDADLQKAWAAMERIKQSGKAKSIGVSNYEEYHLRVTLETAKVAPAIIQIEFHPYMTERNNKKLLDQLRTDDIAVSAYGVLTPMTRNIPGPLDETLERLAKAKGVSAGLVLLRWCIEQNVVAITTSQKESRMKEYLGVLELELSDEEVLEITDAGQQCLQGKELQPRMLHYLESLKAASRE